jgi:Ca-activated chloride channel family protein
MSSKATPINSQRSAWLLAGLSMSLTGAAPARPEHVDPFGAYKAGKFEDSLNGFLDLEVERPNDPRVQQNLGSAYYKLGRYEDAEKRFFQGNQPTAEAKRRAQLEYDLGNTAFRRGQLDQAAGHYQKALELTPDDADASFNLEFVRREIKRREQQAQDQQKERREQKDQQQKSPQAQRPKPDDKKQQPMPAGSEDQKNDEKRGAAKSEAEQKDLEMSSQEAERLLRSVNEERPKEKKTGRDRPYEKDW